MTTLLIKIESSQFKNEIKESINARLLWKSLESKSDFSTWIKNRLQDFDKNIDYICFHEKMEANNARKIEYMLSIETAKHIAMLERNKKGKEIRNYFIEKEKEAMETKHLTPEEKRFRAIMKHTQISEQKRNSKNLNWAISNSLQPESLAKVHSQITSAISGKSPTKWKQLGMKKYEKEQEKIQAGELKPRNKLYKKSDIVSGLGVIRVENKPIASAISLAHNCIAEKNAPLNLGIETGKSSLDLFKNLEKIEELNNKENFIIKAVSADDRGRKEHKEFAKDRKKTCLKEDKDIVNLAEVRKKLLRN